MSQAASSKLHLLILRGDVEESKRYVKQRMQQAANSSSQFLEQKQNLLHRTADKVSAFVTTYLSKLGPYAKHSGNKTFSSQRLPKITTSCKLNADGDSSGLGKLDFNFTGVTIFGNNIALQVTPLGLAVFYRQWNIFKGLLQVNVDSNQAQKLLIINPNNTQIYEENARIPNLQDAKLTYKNSVCVQNFQSALEMYLWAVVRPTYFLPNFVDAEFMAILKKLIKYGANLSLVRTEVLRSLTNQMSIEIYRTQMWETEANTGISREAASLMRCLLQNGLQAPTCIFVNYGITECNFYFTLVVFIARHLAAVFSHNNTIAHNNQRQILPRLRALTVLFLNIFYSAKHLYLPRISHLLSQNQAYFSQAFLLGISNSTISINSNCNNCEHQIFSNDYTTEQQIVCIHQKFQKLLKQQPLRLAVLARFVVRNQLESCNFQKKLTTVNISDEMQQFITFLESRDLCNELSMLLNQCEVHPKV